MSIRDYQPPIIHTYQITPEMREWRVLRVNEQKAVNHKRLVVAAVITALWAATALSIYFLATTSHGTLSNAIYISVVAVGSSCISVLTIAFGSAIPVLKTPKFEDPGVSEAMILHITEMDIDVLCGHLEQNGGVSPLVQRGFLLPLHGKVLTDYMVAGAQEVPDVVALQALKAQWDEQRASIAAEYAKDITLEEFNAYEGFGGVSRSSRALPGGKLDTLLKSYNASNRIVKGFEAQMALEQLGPYVQYQRAKKDLLGLEKQWQEFKKGTIPEIQLKIDL